MRQLQKKAITTTTITTTTITSTITIPVTGKRKWYGRRGGRRFGSQLRNWFKSQLGRKFGSQSGSPPPERNGFPLKVNLDHLDFVNTLADHSYSTVPAWKQVWKPVWKEIQVPAWKEIQVPAWKKIWKPIWVPIKVPAWKEIQVPDWKKIWKPIWKEIQIPAWKEIEVSFWSTASHTATLTIHLFITTGSRMETNLETWTYQGRHTRRKILG